MFYIQDTICAIATPPGEGALGIIRFSGVASIPIANSIFYGKNLLDVPANTLHFGKIKDNDEFIDEVILSVFKAPKSFTGEDIVEISCHGSHYILNTILELCIKKGARLAKPGEFTLRAFLNGKMDLTQAEAVADLISSHSAASHKSAMHHLRGGFRKDLLQIREQLIKFSALIELELDFSGEDVEFADRNVFNGLLNEIISFTEKLVSSFKLGNVIKNGVKVAIIGKPNAGKSTLLNTLLNEERAIVSEMPGTTRDTIEELININGIFFRLIDTAGIREHTLDTIEEKGILRSWEARKQADVVLYVFDLLEEPLEDLFIQIENFKKEGINYVLIGNKVDQNGVDVDNYHVIEGHIIFISAQSAYNVNQLKERLYQMAGGNNLNKEDSIITNIRHYEALKKLLRSLHDIKQNIAHNLPSDLLSLDIRHSLQFIGDITGMVTTDEKLDYIFSQFCIGK